MIFPLGYTVTIARACMMKILYIVNCVSKWKNHRDDINLTLTYVAYTLQLRYLNCNAQVMRYGTKKVKILSVIIVASVNIKINHFLFDTSNFALMSMNGSDTYMYIFDTK